MARSGSDELLDWPNVDVQYQGDMEGSINLVDFARWLESSIEDETQNLDKNNQIEDAPSQLQSQSQQATVNPLEARKQAAPSNDLNQPRKRGRRAKLTEDEKKENKRKCDKNYRDKKKRNEENLASALNNMSEEARLMKADNEELIMENKRLQDLVDKLKTFFQGQIEEANKIKNFHQDINSNCQEAVFAGSHLSEDPEMLKLFQDALVPGGFDANVIKILGSSQSIICNTNAPATEFLRELDADERSNVDCQHFMIDLNEEKKTVGRYQVPSSLVRTAERINEVHGDVCATCKLRPGVAADTYILFCAAIKVMKELPLEQVTEEKMLNWRDAIKDALRIEFKVEFAMELLKKIARGYFGLKDEEVENIDIKISNLEAQLNGLKERNLCIEIAKELKSKQVGEGLWP